MPDILAPSLVQVERTLAADIAYTISRMQVLERLPGNPIGISYRWVDDRAVALSGLLPSFARVIGLRTGHEPQIAEIARWYREQGVKPTFEMVPGHSTESLGRELARQGYFQSGFHTCLVGEANRAAAVDDRLAIERVGPDSFDYYLDAYVAGWGIAIEHQVQFKANVRPWLDQPGWSLYLGRSEGRPAAAATLYLKDGVGYLADAATSPAFRGLGLQSALLRRRIADAASAGAEFVCSGAAPFSTSHRNMERAGLRVLFMRSLWTLV